LLIEYIVHGLYISLLIDKFNNMHQTVMVALLQTAQRVNYEITKALAPLDLTAQQLKVLNIVFEFDGHQATVNDIKKHMLDPNSNVSRLLNKLMQKKWIEKVRDHNDQRIVFIKITDLGKRVMCDGKVCMDQAMMCAQTLTVNELTSLNLMLNKIQP